MSQLLPNLPKFPSTMSTIDHYYLYIYYYYFVGTRWTYLLKKKKIATLGLFWKIHVC